MVMQDEIENLLTQSRHARFKTPDDAKRDLAEAVRLARASDDRLQLAQTLTALGQIERDLHLADEALRHYEEAAAIYRTAEVPLKVAHTIRHIGDIHQDEGRLGEAEPFYREALAIYRVHKETPLLDLANAIRPLALLTTKTSRPQEAKMLWEETRKLYAAVNVDAGVAESTRQIGLLEKR
ncbi:MAG: tetratricopeptide repeat protein [Acidobacteriia bacterium]|nr:tetratricopeptide repeat protein [Terriglobia bacterium]